MKYISDSEPVGLDFAPVNVPIANGRILDLSLDKNGVTMVSHVYDHVDYYDKTQVVSKYYPECCRLVKKVTGASKVYAFDHNVRSARKFNWMNQEVGVNVPIEEVHGSPKEAASAVQIVHNDYTLTSAPMRVQQLGQPSKITDTLRDVLGETPLLSQGDLKDLEGKRYVFINVWRNIADEPVQDMPLALCDAESFTDDDLVVFELRYPDRTGENYFVKHNPNHKWIYYPQIVKDEAILLKVWDSHGKITALENDMEAKDLKPASFSFHTAFSDPNAPSNSPKRESIECRLIAVY